MRLLHTFTIMMLLGLDPSDALQINSQTDASLQLVEKSATDISESSLSSETEDQDAHEIVDEDNADLATDPEEDKTKDDDKAAADAEKQMADAEKKDKEKKPDSKSTLIQYDFQTNVCR